MVYIVTCLKEKRFKRNPIYRIIYVSIFPYVVVSLLESNYLAVLCKLVDRKINT